MVVHALNSIGTARFQNGQKEGREQLERSLELAIDADLADDVSRAFMHLVWIARRWRSYSLAEEYLNRGLQYTSERGLELWRGYLLSYRAEVELDRGLWLEAIETATLVLGEPRRSRIPQIVALSVIARGRARLGDPEVWSPLEEARSLAQRGEELQALEPLAAAAAEASWLSGDSAGVQRATAAPLARGCPARRRN
jgi:hypothetical protein